MSLWLTVLYYMMAAYGFIFYLFLLLTGHWLGISFAITAVSLIVLAVILGIGKARGRPWAHRLSRILFND